MQVEMMGLNFRKVSKVVVGQAFIHAKRTKIFQKVFHDTLLNEFDYLHIAL